jgi:hypothetical protein
MGHRIRYDTRVWAAPAAWREQLLEDASVVSAFLRDERRRGRVTPVSISAIRVGLERMKRRLSRERLLSALTYLVLEGQAGIDQVGRAWGFYDLDRDELE